MPGRRRPPRAPTTAARRAAAVGLVSAVAFVALLLVVVVSGRGPVPPDAAAHTWSVEHRNHGAVLTARLVTHTGTGLVPYVLVLLAGLYAGRPRDRGLACAAGFLGCLIAGQLTRYLVMVAVARPRPPVADFATDASRWSFPSGHTTTAALTAGLVVAALLIRGSRRLPLALALLGGWAVAVGLTRVYLGVHWVTDVLGGWLFATAWLGGAGWALLRAGRRPRE